MQTILLEARKALQGNSVQESTKCLEKLGEASKILTEVILYNPSALKTGEKETPPTEEI